MPARRLKKTSAHLEITAFINLIVVLVPFLLSVSVFTHLAVIDLSLPAQSNEQVQKLDPNKPLKLEVIVRANRIEVNDKHGGALPGTTSRLVRSHHGFAWVALFNGRSGTPGFDNELDAALWSALDKVTSLPTHDLFSTFR